MNSLNSCAHILNYFTASGIIVRYGYGCLNKINQIACRQPFMIDYMAFGQRFFRYVFVKFRTRKQLTCSIEYMYPQTPVAKKDIRVTEKLYVMETFSLSSRMKQNTMFNNYIIQMSSESNIFVWQSRMLDSHWLKYIKFPWRLLRN